MNDAVQKSTWLKRNWKWLIPVILLLTIFGMSLPKGVGNATLHIAKGYSDSEVPENALKIVKKNERVSQMLGELEPIGKLTILEGYVNYSKNADSVFMALTLKGSKGKGKMDIGAFKNNGEWHYEHLKVRLKEPFPKRDHCCFSLTQHKNT